MHSKSNQSGSIQLIFGPMFSGKSTELMRRVQRYQIAGKKCLLIKYSKDDRYADMECASHDGKKLAAVKAEKLSSLVSHIDNYEVIGIDEGQFFHDIVDFADRAANKTKTVLVAALDGTFERKRFNSILELVPLAEHVTKLSAVCMSCGDDAAFTKRLDSSDKRIESIGGADQYKACCRSCWTREHQENSKIIRYPLNDNFANIESTKENREVKS
jgi:thymidine kinase